MATTRSLGDLAELAVATDLRRRGYQVSFPFGEDCDYDLIVDRDGSLGRVQVKYARSHGVRLEVRCRSHSLTNGAVRRTKRYTAATIEWLAVFDDSSGCCYYIPAEELGSGRSLLTLRLTPPRNNQRLGIRMASHYEELR